MGASVAPDHAITALSIGHVLTAEAADAAAHVAIDLSPNERHLAHVVHARADEETGIGPGRGGEKAADLIRQMLAVSIEQDDALDLFAPQPVAQTGLNRFPFPDIHRVHDDFCAAFARAGRGRVARAVVDHQDMIELGTGPLGHPADVRFLVIGRNDCSDIAAIERPAWLRGRGLHR